MSRLSRLPAPLPLFDPPKYRVLVRWHLKEPEQTLTFVATLEEAQAWLEALKKGKPHAYRVDEIGGET